MTCGGASNGLIIFQGYWTGAAALSVHNLNCKHTSPSHPTPLPPPLLPACRALQRLAGQQGAGAAPGVQQRLLCGSWPPGNGVCGHLCGGQGCPCRHAGVDQSPRQVGCAACPAVMPASLWACICQLAHPPPLPACLPVCLPPLPACLPVGMHLPAGWLARLRCTPLQCTVQSYVCLSP